ncbi:nucleotide exchange factor sil1 [Ciborinia camelliae]|nr:nucleotide exchange factor sil1 [Ciborinia camelliae]
MVNFQIRSILGPVWLLTLLIFTKASSMDPAASPSADTELICPTENPAECYPRLFQPTKDFQIIKLGQNIPPGLHVRLNINSGLKEARLNIPTEDENIALGLDIPTEQALVVIEDADVESAEEPQPSSSPPALSSHGKIQPPPPSSSDFESFGTSLASLKRQDASLDLALTSLAELSHDIYYGSELMADEEAVSALICLMAMEPSRSEDVNDHSASAILSGSLQNNPTAIESISLFHDIVMTPTCSGLREKGLSLIPALQKKLSTSTISPSALKSQISALSGLLKSPQIQKSFLEQDGTSYLQSAFLKSGSQYDVVRQHVVQLLMDNFLDESMGARMGVWPRANSVQRGEKECNGDVVNDECWAWHGKTFYGTEGGKKEWMEEFLGRLEKSSQSGERGREL